MRLAFNQDLQLPPASVGELPPPTENLSPRKPPALFPVAQPEGDPLPNRAQPTPGTQEGQPPTRLPPSAQADRRCLTADDIKAMRLIDLNIELQRGDIPKECLLVEDYYEPRCWPVVTYTWKASALCHKPLYFEEVGLERYGHSQCLSQPFISGAHFFGSIALLPYKMGVEDPFDCHYALGYYRPGNCAPKLFYTLPLSARGAVYQGAAVSGLVFLMP